MPSHTEISNTSTHQNRLIFALDIADFDEAKRLIDLLSPEIKFFKVGLQLFTAVGPAVIHYLAEKNLRVFLDLKMDDVAETIRLAVESVASLPNVDFLTILGGPATARAARKGKGDSSLEILSVTLLTSLNQEDLAELGLMGRRHARFKSLEEFVLWRAQMALTNGCDGLVASGQNVALLRSHFGPDPTIVCPGIRPAGVELDEHKRSVTPSQAIASGADFLVVGRPIRDDPNPAQKAGEIRDEIEAAISLKSHRN